MKLNKNDRREPIDYAVDKILQKQYGDMISYKELEKWMGFERNEGMLLVLMSCVKDRLIEYGYVLRNVFNEGYQILHPNEIAEEVIQKHLKQSNRKLDRAVRIMKCADRNILSKEELKFFKQVENIVVNSYEYSENMLFEAQAVLGGTKLKELGG